MTRDDRINGLISLDEKINSELLNLQSNLEEILKNVSDEDGHGQYLSRISYIQTLFDRASDILREISLVDSDSNFYDALKAKDRIATNYIKFNRLKNQIEQFLSKDRQAETDSMARVIQSVQQIIEEPSEEELPADDSYTQDELQEDQFMAEDEKPVKKKKPVQRKSDVEKQRFLEDERRYQENQRRMEEELRNAETDNRYQDDTYEHTQSDVSYPDYEVPYSNDYPDGRPKKPVSAADLRDEQYREEEKREAERERERARRQETHDKFIAYQDEHRPDMPPTEKEPQSKSPSYDVPINPSPSKQPEKSVTTDTVSDERYREADGQFKEHDSGRSNRYETSDYPSGRPEKPVTAADLRDEQYREDEKRETERERERAHRQERHDKFTAYQDEHRPEMPSTENTPSNSSFSYGPHGNGSSNQYRGKPTTTVGFGDEQHHKEEGRFKEQESNHARTEEQAIKRSENPSYQDKPLSTPERVSTHETPRYKGYDSSSPSSTGKTSPDISRGPKPVQGHERVSEPLSHPKTTPQDRKKVSPPPAYAFTPAGIAHLNPVSSQSKSHGAGSFQGVHIQQNIKKAPDKTSSPKTPPLSSETKAGTRVSPGQRVPAQDSSVKTQAGSVHKPVKPRAEGPQTEFTQYGYTPTGVFANTAVNGVMGRKHTTYKVSKSGPAAGVKPSVGKPAKVSSASNRSSDQTKHSQKGPDAKVPSGAESRVPRPVPRKGEGNPFRTLETSRSSRPNETTGQAKRGNANRAQKSTVKEPAAALRKNNHLRSRAIAATYAKAMGRSVARYAGNAVSLGARKLYYMLQEGDNNALRGFESTRYYGMATVGAAKALTSRKFVQHSVNKAFGKKVKAKNIGKELHSLKEAHNEILKKKFGGINNLSKKSLSKQIKALKEEGRSLKGQIKALESKGSALSGVERKKLMQLKKEHKALSQRLRKLIGLEKARLELDKKLKKAQKVGKKALKNRGAVKNGLFALQRSLMNSLHKSDELGVQGFAKVVNLSTNRYVHIFVKNSLRASWKITKASWSIATSTGRVAYKGAKVVGTAGKQVVKKVASKVTNKALVKTGHTAGKMAGELAQKKVKTVSGQVVKKVLKKPHAAGAKKLFQAASKGSVQLVSSAKRGIQLLSSLVKGASLKVIGIILAFILLIGVITAVISSVGSSAGSLILSPDASDDGKFDLSSYYNIILDEWDDYIKALNKKGKQEGAEKIVVNMDAVPDNAREILSMMAVRMNQNLELDKNDEIEPYIRYLTRQLNPYSKVVNKYYCSGCKGDETKYCSGHKMITFSVTSMYFGPAEELDDPIFSADEMANEDQEVIKGGLIGKFEITYYAPTGNPTATGTQPKAGRTIAVDPSVIPLHSHVIIDGHEYVAEDTGSAIKGNIIDIFVNSEAEAIEKGRRKNVSVYSVGYEGEDIQSSGKWKGWTQGNRQWAKNIYFQNWGEIYSGIPMTGGAGNTTTDLSGVNFVDGQRKGNQRIVDIAKAQEGYSEGAKFYKWYGFDYHVHWCATFVSWCSNQAGVLGSAVPKFASCSLQGAPWFQSRGQWARPGDITPVAGDIIFFDWQVDGRTDHVGIVIGSDGSKVYTVEGNTGGYPGKVKIKSYSLSYKCIYGYGIPNY